MSSQDPVSSGASYFKGRKAGGPNRLQSDTEGAACSFPVAVVAAAAGSMVFLHGGGAVSTLTPHCVLGSDNDSGGSQAERV